MCLQGAAHRLLKIKALSGEMFQAEDQAWVGVTSATSSMIVSFGVNELLHRWIFRHHFEPYIVGIRRDS